MSKKDYVDFAVLEYRVESITKTKLRLKRERSNEHRSRGLISKRIAKARNEENYLWIKLHHDRRDAQRKGNWNENYERVMEC